MQYPQIQFYRGSLVRLASGELKQVEDLNSDDFLESAKLARLIELQQLQNQRQEQLIMQQQKQQRRQQQGNSNQFNSLNSYGSKELAPRFRPQSNLSYATSVSQSTDENNNSVFNSPEPGQAAFFAESSPQNAEMMMETDDELTSRASAGHEQNRLTGLKADDEGLHADEAGEREGEGEEEDDDEELDVVTSNDEPFNLSKLTNNCEPFDKLQSHSFSPISAPYIDSSVVKDFLEVGPAASSTANSPTSSASSPTSGFLSSNMQAALSQQKQLFPSTSSSLNSNNSNHSSQAPNSPNSAGSPQSQTVLIKFFLESSRQIVFIEVPIERPFFVFHRGWSSWSPQRTYDKFGLKCRKLKIGDTCISLINRQTVPSKANSPATFAPSPQQTQRHMQQQHNHNHLGTLKREQQRLLKDSHDQCNILFSSIKIDE